MKSLIIENEINDKEYLIRGVPVLGALKNTNEIIGKLQKKDNNKGYIGS